MTIGNGNGGRDELFRSMYEKYYRRIVWFYVRSFHMSEEDAQDLAQDAFVRFYEAIADYRGDAEWAFLEEIARNVAYNKIRATLAKKRHAPMVDLDDPSFRRGPVAPDNPEKALLRKQLYEQIAALPPGQRQSMLLWLEGFEYKEIASALRITMDAVKSRIRDGKKLLKLRLGVQLPEDDK